MTGQFRVDLTRERVSWFVVSFATGPLALLVYVMMEWLFFMTKPSMLMGLAWWHQLLVLVAAPFPVVPVVLLIQLLCSVCGLVAPSRVRGVAVVPAAVILGLLIVILLDNFTYVLFDFGVVSSGPYSRLLYIVAIIAAVAGSGRIVVDLVRAAVSTGSRYRLAALMGVAVLCGATVAADRHLRESQIERNLEVSRYDLNSDSVTAGSDSGGTSPMQPQEERTRPNILFLSADGLVADRLSVYGYERQTTPFLEELRPEWRLFENAFSNGGTTHGSILSMLTGKTPIRTRVVYPPQTLQGRDAHEHLPGILRKHGYRTVQLGMRYFADAHDAGAVGAFDYSNYRWEGLSGDGSNGLGTGELTPTEAGAGITDPHLQLFRESVRDRIEDRLLHVLGLRRMVDHHAHVVQEKEMPHWNDQKRIQAAIDFIQQLEEPWFMQIHLTDTHCCERRPRNSFFYPSVGPPYDGARFDGEIRDADSDIRRIIEAVAEEGRLDDTLIVVTSDHTSDWSTLERIPLLIRFPAAEHAGTESANAQLIDLPVTVLDYMGIPVPGWMEGDSLLRGIDPSRPIYSVSRIGKLEEDRRGLARLSRFGPPFYGVGSFALVTGDQFFELNLVTGSMNEGRVPGHTQPLRGQMSARAARRLLTEELDSAGFGVGSALVTTGDRSASGTAVTPSDD